MSDQPNVVAIMTDQQRADVSAREGFELDTTPFLDQLASRGRWFNRAYTSIPVCAPARVSFLTGRFPGATRVDSNQTAGRAVYEEDLFDVMNDQGYATAMVGKNHSHLSKEKADHWVPFGHRGGKGKERTEQERAMDEWLDELRHGVSTEPTPYPVSAHPPYRIVEEAQDWVRSLTDESFFLWLSIPEPHNPYYAPEPYFSMFPPEELPPVRANEDALTAKGFDWRWTRGLQEAAFPQLDDLLPRMRSNYFGMLRLIDDQTARFVDFLEDQGVREDTIIIFLSDHGDFVGDYGLMRKGPGVPEVLARIPLLFQGPGIGDADTPHPAHVSLVDVLPTVCEAIGAEIPDGVQGRSLWPLLTGKQYPDEEFRSIYAEQGVGGLPYTPGDDPDLETQLPESIRFNELYPVQQSGRQCMVRKDDWKLVYDSTGQGRLYDLSEDPFELEDHFDSAEHEETKRELVQELLQWQIRIRDPLPFPGEYGPKTHSHNYRETD